MSFLADYTNYYLITKESQTGVRSFDYETNALFVNLWHPASQDTGSVCRHILSKYDKPQIQEKKYVSPAAKTQTHIFEALIMWIQNK